MFNRSSKCPGCGAKHDLTGLVKNELGATLRCQCGVAYDVKPGALFGFLWPNSVHREGDVAGKKLRSDK